MLTFSLSLSLFLRGSWRRVRQRWPHCRPNCRVQPANLADSLSTSETRQPARYTHTHSLAHTVIPKSTSPTQERAHAARIADLEAQSSKAHTLTSQLRKSKEEAERQQQSRLRSLQEQLDTANVSRRSMETYINFLKASYSTLCSEAGSHTAPPFHMLN